MRIGGIAIVDIAVAAATYAYHHTDHLGGTHVETDSSGNLLQYMVYEPYGKIRHNYKAGSYGNDYTYTGKELDSETTLQYFGARYYSGIAGRFTSEDLVFLNLGAGRLDPTAMKDPQKLNSYAYVRNSPYSDTDPDGSCFWDFCVGETLAFISVATITWTAAASLAVAIPAWFGEIDAYTRGNNALGNAYSDIVIGSTAVTGIVAGEMLPYAVIGSAGTISTNTINQQQTRFTSPEEIRSNLGNASGRTINGSISIPSSWTVSKTDGVGGFRYTDPNNPINEIRLMPGNPVSRYETSRSPYVRIRTESGYTDINGIANSDQANTHIPLTSIE